MANPTNSATGPMGSAFPENERTSFDTLGMTDKEDVKILYYPRIAVLQDKISNGEPITQAIINEIYDMAHSLLKHRHKYEDYQWVSFGNTTPYPDAKSTLYTDYPAQINSMVDLGGQLMEGIVFEKWFLCPSNNISVLDASPMIYTRQFALPSDGIYYNTGDTNRFPTNLQKTGIGLMVEFFIDTSDVIGTEQEFTVNVDDSALLNLDNEIFSFSIGPHTISYTPKNTRTRVVLQWVQQGQDSNIATNQGYVYLFWNNAAIPRSKIYCFSPQTSLNSDVKDARVSSIYSLYQLILVLANHSHTYLDAYAGSASNKAYTAQSTTTTLENYTVTKNQQIQFTAGEYSFTYYDENLNQHITLWGGFTGEVSDVSIFSQPVEL